MRIFITALCTAVFVVGCAHHAGPTARTPAQTQAGEDEAALAAALSGMTAGPPQDCVSLRDLDGGSKLSTRSVIVFKGHFSNEVLYVNRPPATCVGLDSGRAIKTRTTMTQLCRGDIVTVFDPMSGIEFGTCALGEFTPYRRTR
jgi:hypothetical protein